MGHDAILLLHSILFIFYNQNSEEHSTHQEEYAKEQLSGTLQSNQQTQRRLAAHLLVHYLAMGNSSLTGELTHMATWPSSHTGTRSSQLNSNLLALSTSSCLYNAGIFLGTYSISVHLTQWLSIMFISQPHFCESQCLCTCNEKLCFPDTQYVCVTMVTVYTG